MPRPVSAAAATRNRDRDKVIRQGKRREGRDVHARYYAVNDHPSSAEFGRPDYIDAAGRQYRLAYLSRLDARWVPGEPVPPRGPAPPLQDAQGHVKLWVKVPRRRRPTDEYWFVAAPTAQSVALQPVTPGLPSVTVRIRAAYRSAPSHRTGHIYVSRMIY